MKTLAIRLEEDQHAQLSMIAKLEEVTVTDAIRQAIEDWDRDRKDQSTVASACRSCSRRHRARRRHPSGAIAALLGGRSPRAISRRSRRGQRPPAGAAAPVAEVPGANQLPGTTSNLAEEA